MKRKGKRKNKKTHTRRFKDKFDKNNKFTFKN